MTTPITLTHKGVQVLELRSQGMTTAAIAEHLGCAESTIGSRIKRAEQKLGAVDITHAVSLAMASGLIGGPEPVMCKAVADKKLDALAEFAEDYKIFRARGMTQREIAVQLGVKHKTVGVTAARARKAGLLPPAKRRGVASC